MFHSKVIASAKGIVCVVKETQYNRGVILKGPMLCLYESYHIIFHYQHTQVRLCTFTTWQYLELPNQRPPTKFILTFVLSEFWHKIQEP